MKQYSLAYLTIPGTQPVDQIRIAKEAGYDFVSLRTIPMHLPGEPEFLLHKDQKLFEAVQWALKEYDIPLMDIELARVRPDLEISEYEPAFEAAARLGGTDVLGSVWTRDKGYYTQQVGKIAEMAKRYGLNYNVEFLPWAGVRNLQEGMTLVDQVGCDNLFLMVDTLHAGRAGVTPHTKLLNPLQVWEFDGQGQFRKGRYHPGNVYCTFSGVHPARPGGKNHQRIVDITQNRVAVRACWSIT